MKSKIITEAEVSALKVASLPTRPTAKEAFGGKGYSAEEMKAAFDKFPEFILAKLNLLINDLLVAGKDSYVGNFQSGTFLNYSLQNLIDGIANGEFAHLLMVNGHSLVNRIQTMEREIQNLKSKVGI